jgi:PAS domain S-box-containing protein
MAMHAVRTEQWNSTAHASEGSPFERAIFETAPPMMLTTDGVLRRVNPAFAMLFGASKEDLEGGPTSVLCRSEQARADFAARVGPPLARGEPVREEVRLQRFDGSTFEARVAGQPITLDGYSHAAVWLIEDISAVRKAELAMQRASDLAQEVADLKSDFIANMSHEIRTPMNAIKGMAHLALRTDLSPQQREYLEKIEQSNRQLMRIVNDMLDFSSMEAGTMTVEPVEFVFDTMLRTVMDSAGPKAFSRRLQLACDVAPSVPHRLIGDALRIGQMLSHLLDNAIKFTDRGEVTLLVLAENDGAQAGTGSVRLRFEVRDTGIGLTEQQRSRIFQTFRQADSSRTRRHGGTGLGLAICKQLVGLMGGDIGVRSTFGNGSTFWLALNLGRVLNTDGLPQAERTPILPASQKADPGFSQPGVGDETTQAQDVLDDLLQLLRDSDATACDIWKQNRRMLRSRFGEQSLVIERAIEDFDFERAAELAAAALRSEVASAPGR